MDVDILKLDLVKENEEGTLHEFANADRPSCVLVKKKAGVVFAEKYHTGKHPERFPKMIYILDGECEVYLKDVRDGEETTKMVTEPTLLKVGPFIYHEFRAKTDTIVLDLNPKDYYDDDTVKNSDLLKE